MKDGYSYEIVSSKALTWFDERILSDGLKANGCSVNIANKDRLDRIVFETGRIYILELHGAGQSLESDKEVLRFLEANIVNKDFKAMLVFHRPDEIMIRMPEVRDILLKAQSNIVLVFFGNNVLNYDRNYKKYYCFDENQFIKRVIIPHGAPLENHIKKHFQLKPVVIGSHTTWGEMRDTSDALMLICETFGHFVDDDIKPIGYLGGKSIGANQLDIGYLESEVKKLQNDLDVRFVKMNKDNIYKVIANRNGFIILVNDNDMTDDFDVTFNIQMFYLIVNGKKTVRLGEAAGSPMRSCGILASAAVEGIRDIIGWQTIEIPYDTVSLSWESIDYRAAACSIADVIKNGRIKEMMEYNLAKTKEWNAKRICKEYIKAMEKYLMGKNE